MPTTSSGALPLGTTFASELARLEATEEGRGALSNARLNDKLLALMRTGDMSFELGKCFLNAKNVGACTRAGIDMERILVAMAKQVANPKPAQGEWVDVLPDLATREDVVAAMIPYVEAMGSAKLSEIFFQGVPGELRQFVNGSRRPSFESLVALIRFLMREEREGQPIRKWTEDRAVYYLAKERVFGRWDPFVPTDDPAPALQDYASFKLWLERCVPAEHVEYVADFTGLASRLLDVWRRGASLPSGEMLVKLLSSVREHKPEWLRVDDGQGASASRPTSEPPEPTAPPARKGGEAPKRIAKKPRAAGADQPSASVEPPPDEDGSPLATAAREVAELLELLAPKLRLMAQCAAQPDPPAREHGDEPVPGFTPISETEPVPEPPTKPAAQEADEDAVVAGRKTVGRQDGRIRFLLTSGSFLPFTGSLTKGEVADTRALLREAARRLAIVNALTGDAGAKDALVNALAADLVALAAQLRGLEFREVATLIGDADMLAGGN